MYYSCLLLALKSSLHLAILIDDFKISKAILLGGANSRQTSIKCCDLACEVEPPPLKNCKDFTMKLKVKYLLPTSSSGANFYIYELPEGLGMREILAHGMRMPKNPQTREDIFWIFTDFHGVVRAQSPTCIPARKFQQWRR